MQRNRIVLIAVTGVCVLSVVAICAACKKHLPALHQTGPEFAAMQQAEMLFVGTLTASQAGPVNQSMPPIYHFQLTFKATDALRGDVAVDAEVTFSYQARQHQPPSFTEGATYIVAGHNDLRVKRLIATWVAQSTDALLAQAELAGAMPLGWTIVDGKVLSPWASLDEDIWPGDVGPGALICAKTGRPALLVGPGVTLTSEKVPPTEQIKWTNPDGDGKYAITVTNTTDQAVDVPALLSDDSGIRWNESLVILCQGAARPAPLAKPLTGPVKPTRLEPGQSVSTVVNAFRLKNVEWPRGGYRVEFTFCLGELATTQSFYYKSDHHDPIREALGE